MSWLNESLSPTIFSQLTGQIKNFTQEVLSDGIINEIGDRSKNIEKTNEECNQLQELLNSKDAVISLLQQQNSELQKVVNESCAKTNDSINNGIHAENEDAGATFWEGPSRSNDQDPKLQTKFLQEKLDEATMRIHELEQELNYSRKSNSSNVKDDANFKEGPSLKNEALRAKQDVMNSVIQMDEEANTQQFSMLGIDNKEFPNNEGNTITNLEKQGNLQYETDTTQTNDVENKLRLRIKELELENGSLSSNIEELDKQHVESIEQVLAIKEEVQKKHQTLQNAYEILYSEHNEALFKIENLHSQQEKQQQELEKLQKSSIKETLDSTVQTLDNLKVDKETEICINLEDKQIEVDLKTDEKLDMESELKIVKDILKDIPFEFSTDNTNESLIISLAHQFVNLKCKKETLEQTLEKENSELKKYQESLLNNCKNMQSKIDSLTIEVDNSKTLLSKLKQSEEHTSSLEKQIESLQVDIGNLRQSNSEMHHISTSTEDLSKDATLLKSETGEMNSNNKNKFDFSVDILKSQLRESSEIMDIMENIKLEIEYTNDEIEELPLQSEFTNTNEENIDENKIKEKKNIISVLKDLHKKIDNDIMRRKYFDSNCQKLIEEIERSKHSPILNENDTTFNALKYSDYYVSNLESEIKVLKNKVLQIDNIEKENRNLKEQIEKITEQQKLQEDENNLQKVFNIKYEIEHEKCKTLEVENQDLRVKLDTFLVEKSDAEVGTNDLKMDNTSSDEFSSNIEYSVILDQLTEKLNEIESLKTTIERDKEGALMAKETVENLSQLISTKDNEIIKMNHSYDVLKKEQDELIKVVQEKHNESLQYHSEIQRLTQLLQEQTANLQKLIAEKDTNLATLQEKESQLLWTQNELQVIKQRLQNIEELSNYEERCGIAEHSVLSNQISSAEEKNKILETAILQDQSNIRYLQEQLTDSQSKEAIALKEVERLRNHLVEIERNYTEEALQSEEIQRTLEARLVQVEEKLKNSSTIYTSASIRANQQVETLQQQLSLMAQQRDDLQNKISASEDKVLSCSASLTNLQLVLEQFQRDKEKDIQAATKRLQTQLQDSSRRQDDLTNEITNLRDQLAEAKECLQAASRLTEQLERKSERIEQLNQEVSRLNELVSTADQRIEKANKSTEGKVDRSLIKNLLLGYISSPANDKVSVLRVFANVLDFNETEREHCGINGTAVKNSWFSSIMNSSSSSSKEQEASLSTAFIKFLESESQPKPQLPALPISNSSINRPGHSRQHSSSSTHSTLLLSNVTLPTFPDFVPARNTGSILKEVLKDS